MATGGVEMQEREMVPATGASGYAGKKESLVAWFVCFHGLVSAVVLAILVVALEKGDAYHRMCQVGQVLAYSSGVEIVAAMLMLALLLARWWCPLQLLAFVTLIYVFFVTMRLSVHLLYFAIVGKDCCFTGVGDFFKAWIPVSLLLLGQLALPSWGAKLVVGHYKSDATPQTSAHCASSADTS